MVAACTIRNTLSRDISPRAARCAATSTATSDGTGRGTPPSSTRTLRNSSRASCSASQVRRPVQNAGAGPPSGPPAPIIAHHPSRSFECIVSHPTALRGGPRGGRRSPRGGPTPAPPGPAWVRPHARSTLPPISSFHPRPTQTGPLTLDRRRPGRATGRASHRPGGTGRGARDATRRPLGAGRGPSPARTRDAGAGAARAAGPPGSPDLRRRSRPGLRRTDPRPPARGGPSGQLRDHRELGPRPSGPGGADGRTRGTCCINHTVSHRSFTGLSDRLGGLSAERRRAELEEADAILAAILGRSTRPWYRLPYGDSDPRVAADVAPTGYTRHAGWTVDSLGWQGHSAPEIVVRCLRLAAPRAIYLFHVGSAARDGPALGAIVSGLRQRGYGFVTLEGLDSVRL